MANPAERRESIEKMQAVRIAGEAKDTASKTATGRGATVKLNKPSAAGIVRQIATVTVTQVSTSGRRVEGEAALEGSLVMVTALFHMLGLLTLSIGYRPDPVGSYRAKSSWANNNRCDG